MTLGDFSKQAAAYERARPGYPDSLVDVLVSEASVQQGESVVEFGAGTGIFTRLLVDRKFDVTAVEPNTEMMRQADLPRSELEAPWHGHPGRDSRAGSPCHDGSETASRVRWVQGTFEENSLPDNSQAWAVAAQAFHWADPAIALPRVRRVLKPDCVFTVLWNDRVNQDSEILQWTADAIGRHVPEFDEAYRDWSWGEVLESTGDFTLLSHHLVRHDVRMSKDRYLDLWRSHNRLNNVAGPDRFAGFLDELTDYLRRRQIEQLDVPYDCTSWTARRND